MQVMLDGDELVLVSVGKVEKARLSHVVEMFCVLCSSIGNVNEESWGRDRLLNVPFIDIEPDIVVRFGRLMSPVRSVLLAIVRTADCDCV